MIAPFELDPDARGQSGVGFSLGGQAWSRDSLLGGTLLTRTGAHGDFFSKGRFNDVQFVLSSGPEFNSGLGRLRPALTHERRWYGGDRYSKGVGVSLNWLTLRSASAQVEIDGSVIRQSINNNIFLDGYRYFLSAAYDRAFSAATSARVVIRGSVLDAEAKPELLRQGGIDGLLAQILAPASLFVQGGYTKTDGRAPIALFGKTRDDDRFDIGAGVVAHGLSYAGFAPLVRLTYTNSSSNIELYNYQADQTGARPQPRVLAPANPGRPRRPPLALGGFEFLGHHRALSWPLAEVSRSTNSMIAIGAASDRRMPALTIRM